MTLRINSIRIDEDINIDSGFVHLSMLHPIDLGGEGAQSAIYADELYVFRVGMAVWNLNVEIDFRHLPEWSAVRHGSFDGHPRTTSPSRSLCQATWAWPFRPHGDAAPVRHECAGPVLSRLTRYGGGVGGG